MIIIIIVIFTYNNLSFSQWYTLCGDNLRIYPVKQYSGCDKYSLKTEVIVLKIYWFIYQTHHQYKYNRFMDIFNFNVYCTTIKQQQQQQSSRYSQTVLQNDHSIVNTSITGLLPNTTYICCVSAVTSYGESEPVCQNITTTNVTSEFILYCLYQDELFGISVLM